MSLSLSRRATLIFYSTLTLITLVIFVPILAYWQTRGDFVPHLAYVQRFITGDNSVFGEVPNLLYHVLVAIPAKLLPFIALETLSLVVCTALYVALAWAIGWQIIESLAPSRWRMVLALAVTSALLIIAPFTFFTPDNAYFGYFHPYVYHNPTMIPLRLFAWLLFLMSVHSFGDKTGFVWWKVLLAGLLSIAVMLSKPSFTIAFLPALVVFVAICVWQRQAFNKWTIILGILVPSIGVLGFQALVFKGNGVAFQPLLTLELWAYHYDPLANQNLLLKLIASVAFPVIVYGVFWREAWRSVLLNLAWLCALAGMAQAYLFIDTGEPPAGNLMWNAQIGVFVLLSASAVFAVRTSQKSFPKITWRMALVWMVFMCHVLGGVWWYTQHINAQYPDIVYQLW
jgi:hypothetical protein